MFRSLLPGWTRECKACHALFDRTTRGMYFRGGWYCNRLCIPAFWRKVLVAVNGR